MDSLFADLRGLAAALAASGRLRLVAAALLAAGTALAVCGIFVPSAPAVQVSLGSVGGLLWFLAGYLLWYAGLGAGARERWDVRGRWPLARRRVLVCIAALMWCVLLWGIGQQLGSSLLGALNVVMILTLWRLFTATAQERLAVDERLEQIWTERQRSRAERPRWSWARRRRGQEPDPEAPTPQDSPPAP